MEQYKAGVELNHNSDIGIQRVHWFVYFSVACSLNVTGACVQHGQVLDPHSRELACFLFFFFVFTLNEFAK